MYVYVKQSREFVIKYEAIVIEQYPRNIPGELPQQLFGLKRQRDPSEDKQYHLSDLGQTEGII